MKLTKQIREERKSLSYITNINYLLHMQLVKLEHSVILILSFNESKYWFKTNPNILKVYQRSFGYKPYLYWEGFLIKLIRFNSLYLKQPITGAEAETQLKFPLLRKHLVLKYSTLAFFFPNILKIKWMSYKPNVLVLSVAGDL